MNPDLFQSLATVRSQALTDLIRAGLYFKITGYRNEPLHEKNVGFTNT